MEERRVVLDTDFINLITDFRDCDAKDLFKRIFSALDRIPVVHPFVANCELHNNRIAQELIESGDLFVINKADFLPEDDEFEEEFYRNSFSDMYFVITKESLPEYSDIWRRNAGHSFGEIHSILMAVSLGLPLFYSNDGGAKQAASRYAQKRLSVVNAAELAENLVGNSFVTPKERKYLKNYKKRAARERSYSY